MRQALLTLVIAVGGCVVRSSSQTPLVYAVRTGDVATIRTLAAQGIDLNAPSGGNRWTPLIHAVHKNQIASAKALIEAGADVDRATSSGMTALIMAAGYGNTDMVAVLLTAGADPRKKNKDGDSAYDVALSGVTDLDGFTWLGCNDKTIAYLRKNVPGIHESANKGAVRWAKVKRCV